MEQKEELDLFEVRKRLKAIQTEFYGFGNFSIHTMQRIDNRAAEVKSLSTLILGKEDEVTTEMEAAILISKDYHKKHLGLENEIIKEALIHLEYGVGLFLDKT